MLFIGFPGIATGLGLFLGTWLIVFSKTKGSSFDFDAQQEKGAFEKLLPIYVDLTKFVLGLGTGSIVLLVGSSALHSSGRLPDSFASPLFVLAASVSYGIFFMMLLTLHYEAYRHRTKAYTRPKYVLNQALGFSALFCFVVGYSWLIIAVTR
jgi:hypothetical protein